MTELNPQEEVKVGKRTFWQDAVPLPYYGRNLLFQERFTCDCGQKFKKEKDYEHHYRKQHIGEK